MSQEKVNAYKKEKAGRRKQIEKTKRRNKLIRIAIWLVILALVSILAGKAAYQHTISQNTSHTTDVSSNGGSSAVAASESSGS